MTSFLIDLNMITIYFFFKVYMRKKLIYIYTFLCVSSLTTVQHIPLGARKKTSSGLPAMNRSLMRSLTQGNERVAGISRSDMATQPAAAAAAFFSFSFYFVARLLLLRGEEAKERAYPSSQSWSIILLLYIYIYIRRREREREGE